MVLQLAQAALNVKLLAAAAACFNSQTDLPRPPPCPPSLAPAVYLSLMRTASCCCTTT